MTDPYLGREHSKAKHFILKRYLQALAFKVLNFSDITYVDGFSGPWASKTEDFSDSSFMIAISVLQDAQAKILKSKGVRRRIRCFLSEKNRKAFAQLEKAVERFHKPEEHFEIRTYCGEFEDAVDPIQAFVRNSFALVFIDPTGWTGYALPKIKPLFIQRKCEVLINFMYSFINRFAQHQTEENINSLAHILGGSNWPHRLDPSLPVGLAVEKLFRETLKSTGNFDFVASTKVNRATSGRPYFFVVYGTKSLEGLITFRETEWKALHEQMKARAEAKEKGREDKTGSKDLFTGYEAEPQKAAIDKKLKTDKRSASAELMTKLAQGPSRFSNVVEQLLEAYPLRETNVKDICLELAKAGKIENTWGGGNRKPRDDDMIRSK